MFQSSIPLFNVTLSTLLDQQQNTDSQLRRSVEANIRQGWIYVVIPKNSFLNSFERIGPKILLHR